MNPDLQRLMDAFDPPSVAQAWLAAANPGLIPRTRFAPSPTGPLHDGHLLHLHWLFGTAAALGAQVVTRMEDHDQTRSRDEHVTSIIGQAVEFGYLEPGTAPTRQSDHPARYALAFKQLQSAGLLYGCRCSRADLGPPDEFGERHYDGRCQGRPVDSPDTRVIRVMLPDEETRTTDLRLGELVQHPASAGGDPVIRDVHGQWTYQFAVVVDDMADDINFIYLPAPMSRAAVEHAKAFYASEALDARDKTHDAFFQALAGERKSLNSASELADFVAEQGVDRDAFLKAYNSFGVKAQMERAMSVLRGAQVTGTPTVLVAGKYRTSPGMAGGYEEALAVVSYLVEKERETNAE